MATEDEIKLSREAHKLGPGEVKEILRRLVVQGRTCSCASKNCYNLVNIPPKVKMDLSGPPMQYCLWARRRHCNN